MCKQGVEHVPMHLFTFTESVMEHWYLRCACERDEPSCRKLPLRMYIDSHIYLFVRRARTMT